MYENNADEACLLRGTKLIFKQKSGSSQTSRGQTCSTQEQIKWPDSVVWNALVCNLLNQFRLSRDVTPVQTDGQKDFNRTSAGMRAHLKCNCCIFLSRTYYRSVVTKFTPLSCYVSWFGLLKPSGYCFNHSGILVAVWFSFPVYF